MRLRECVFCGGPRTSSLLLLRSKGVKLATCAPCYERERRPRGRPRGRVASRAWGVGWQEPAPMVQLQDRRCPACLMPLQRRDRSGNRYTSSAYCLNAACDLGLVTWRKIP